MAGNNTAVVKVLADNADLTRKLAQSERKLKGFERAANRAGKNTKGTFGNLSKSAQGVGGPVGGLTGKLGGVGAMLSSLKSPAGIAAAGFAGVALAAKGLQEALDVTRGIAKETNKLKRETGLSAEAASGYLAIADRFGISGGKLSTQFGFLSKRMKAASGGTKGAATALAQFADAGVSEATVKSGDLNRVLIEAADKFAAMKDGPAKTALAMQLFGRSGKDLLPILNQGGSGIEALQEKMQALGLTIGEDTVKQSKELGKATKDLSQVFRGLMNTVGQKVLPIVTEFASAVSEAVVAFRTGKKPTTDFQRVIHNLGTVFVWVGKNWDSIKTALVNSFKTAFPFITGVVKTAVSILKTDWGGMGRSISRTVGNIKRSVVNGFNTVVNFLKAVGGKISGTASRIGGALLRGIKNGALGAKNWVVNAFNGIVGFVSGVAGRLGSLASRAGSRIKNGIVGALRGVAGGVRDAFNGVVGIIRGLVNPIVDNVNVLIRGFNKLPGGDISPIPRMANGGVVRRATVAMIGEAGAEAVVPLTRPRRARQVMAEAGLLGGGGGNNYFTINTTGSVDEQQLAAKIGWQLASRGIA